MTDRENGGEVIRLYPGMPELEVQDRFSSEYAENLAKPLVQALMRHGLHPVFSEGTHQHIADIHTVLYDDLQETPTTQVVTSRPSRLTLERVASSTDEARSEWKRVMIVNKTDLNRRITQIKGKFQVFPLTAYEYDEEELATSVYDWILAEEAITAAANAVHMYRSYGRYMPDFNGQNPGNKAELTISTDFLSKKYNDLVADDMEHDFNATNDYINLKRGFGLMVLHSSLIARGVAPSDEAANHLLTLLRRDDGGAFRADEVEARLSSIGTEQDFLHRIWEYDLSLLLSELDELGELDELEDDEDHGEDV